jgi:hypothetical protein
MSMAKVMGPFRNSQSLSWLSEPWTDVPAEPLLIGPTLNKHEYLDISEPLQKTLARICLCEE